MKKQTKEIIKRLVVITVVLFMVLMLILAYMPMIFSPKQPDRRVGGQDLEIIKDDIGTSTQNVN